MQKVSNKIVRDIVNVKQDIIQTVMGRKLNLFGHICRMEDSRLVKKVMLGGIEGQNRRGRPCKEWLDDITEWTGKEVHELFGLAQNRNRWSLIVKNALDTYRLIAYGCL